MIEALLVPTVLTLFPHPKTAPQYPRAPKTPGSKSKIIPARAARAESIWVLWLMQAGHRAPARRAVKNEGLGVHLPSFIEGIVEHDSPGQSAASFAPAG